MNKFKFWALVLVTILGLNILQPMIRPASVHAAAGQLRITEIMYDPSGNGDREFVELYNGGDISANLSSMTMVGVDFTFAAGTTLGSGQYGVVVRNLAAFRANNPGSRIFGQYGGKLQGSGESVQLVSGGAVLSQVDYQFGGAWPSSPRNGGPSLSLIRPTANEALAACWAPSAGVGGTPGAANNLDTSWSAAHSGGCGTKAYPTTAAAAPAAPAAKAQALAAAAQAAQQAAAQAKKEEEKKAQLEKQAKAEAAVIEKAKAETAAANATKARQSRLTLIIAVIGTLLVVLTGMGFLLYKKLRHKHRFKKLVKEQEKSGLHEKAA